MYPFINIKDTIKLLPLILLSKVISSINNNVKYINPKLKIVIIIKLI